MHLQDSYRGIFEGEAVFFFTSRKKCRRMFLFPFSILVFVTYAVGIDLLARVRLNL